MQGKAVSNRYFGRTLRIVISIGVMLSFHPLIFARGRGDNWVAVEGQEIWQKEFDVSGVRAGKHNFLLEAKDSAGNVTVDGAYNIIVDPRAGLPEVRIVFPSEGTILRGDTDFLGVASGRFGIEQVQVQLDENAPVLAEGSQYWKYQVNTRGTPEGTVLEDGSLSAGPLTEGRHVLYVFATDKKKTNGPQLQIPFIFDKTPPAVEFTGLESGDRLSGRFVMNGQADDANGIASLEISMDGGESFTALKVKRNTRSTAVSFEQPFNTLSYPDGAVFVQLRAVDTTGLVNVRPYLFYVDNYAPVLEVLSPKAGENSWGETRVTGRVYDAVGLSKFTYEFKGETVELPIRPGDPYFYIDVRISAQDRNPVLRLTAVDKSDNETVLTHRFTDNRRVKTPMVILDYPTSSTSLSALQADESIYGRISEGFVPETIIVEGFVEELPAEPVFRIPPDMFPSGRTTVRLWAKGDDGTVGSPFTLRINKPATSEARIDMSRHSPIVISNHEPYDFIREGRVTLQGRIAQVSSTGAGTFADESVLAEMSALTDISAAAELLESRGRAGAGTSSEVPYATLIAQGGAFTLEYRIGPTDGWKPVSVRSDGAFTEEIDMEAIGEGPIHMELRTSQRGIAHIPLYFPLNRVTTEPEIEFITPVLESAEQMVNGTVTVTGKVHSVVPITEIEYTIDGGLYTPIEEIKSAYQAFEFAVLVDFTAIERAGGKLAVRVTDENGALFEKALETGVDVDSDDPVIVFNQPLDQEVVITDMQLSGIAVDDDAVAAVYWRLVRQEDTSSNRSRVFYWEDEDPKARRLPIDFTKVDTDQSFLVDIPMSDLADGEYLIEVKGEDIYGVQGQVYTRTIKVSTADPLVSLVEPAMTTYNKGIIYLKGTAEDRNGIDNVWLSLDNGHTWQRAEGTMDWRLSLNTWDYADGEYALLMRAVDIYGRQTIDTAMINIDNTAPEMDFALPENNQYLGDTLSIAARVQDNIQVAKIIMEMTGVEETDYKATFNIDPTLIILQDLDISGAPRGQYNIRLAAWDLADNVTVASRNVWLTTEELASTAAIFNPLPGEVHTGPVFITGQTKGLVIPTEAILWANREQLATVPVDRYGCFVYQFPMDQVPEDGRLILSVSYVTPQGDVVFSNEHPITVEQRGPVVSVESHEDGQVISGRPWLKGRAWMDYTIQELDEIPKSERKHMSVEQVLVSFDNGRSFQRAKGKEQWKFRLECSYLGNGPRPVLIRAEFGDGRYAMRRILLTIDNDPPQLRTLEPPEDSYHRDSMLVYGTAFDQYEFDYINIQLRPGDKRLYEMPGFIQGLYFETAFLGATYASVAAGLTFFEDNVKLQFQAGLAPNNPSRYPGTVFGMKLLANIYNLKFEYLFGPDWSYFSTSWALGANFSYFSMTDTHIGGSSGGAEVSNTYSSEAQVLGAILAQWEILKVRIPQIKFFRTYSVYMEPALWFTTSDVAGAERFKFRISFGLRVGLF